jgi:hypothetical protein
MSIFRKKTRPEPALVPVETTPADSKGTYTVDQLIATLRTMPGDWPVLVNDKHGFSRNISRVGFGDQFDPRDPAGTRTSHAILATEARRPGL